jgi:hypothetical protein
MPITRQLFAIVAGAAIAAAACKGERAGAGGGQESASADGIAVKAGDRIPAGGAAG